VILIIFKNNIFNL